MLIKSVTYIVAALFFWCTFATSSLEAEEDNFDSLDSMSESPASEPVEEPALAEAPAPEPEVLEVEPAPSSEPEYSYDVDSSDY